LRGIKPTSKKKPTLYHICIETDNIIIYTKADVENLVCPTCNNSPEESVAMLLKLQKLKGM